MISKIISNCISIFFPPFCFICKKENIGVSLCKECLSKIQKPIDSPAPYIISIFSYKNPYIKKAIHAIKYFHRKDLLDPFAISISEEIKKIENYTSYTLVPIPMPQLRKYIRGYNHTEALTLRISNELKLPYRKDILLSNKKTHSKRQVTMHSKSERMKNKQNAFTTSCTINNMNILLIDDVTTTGATLGEARRVLLGAGASRIVACTIAH